MMGLSNDAYLALRRINARHDGEKLLEPAEACERLHKIVDELEGHWLVLLIGGEAARCFSKTEGLLPGNPVDHKGHRFIHIPHTSGVNRVWNIKANREFYEKLLQSQIARISG